MGRWKWKEKVREIIAVEMWMVYVDDDGCELQRDKETRMWNWRWR